MLLFLLQETKAWYNDPLAIATTAATVVIALATIVGIAISAKLWKVTSEYTQAAKEYTQVTKEYTRITKDIFEAAHRPYVGVVGISKLDKEDDPSAFFARLRYRNFGSVPALNVSANISFLIDGTDIYPPKKAEVVFTMNPSVEKFGWFDINDSKTLLAIATAKQVVIHFSCTYKGLTDKTYSFEEDIEYNRRDQGFYVIHSNAT
jgi:hypothetical protein